MSALALFLKDMEIVHSEARRLECPVPLASAALQQFIAGASLGLAREDDSQVVRVYEALSGVTVRRKTVPESGTKEPLEGGKEGGTPLPPVPPSSTPPSAQPSSERNENTTTTSTQEREGDAVGDYWILPDGTRQLILEVGDEPRHNTILSNRHTRVLRVQFPHGDTTLVHRHAEDSLYFFLSPDGLNEVVNHVKGSDPKCDCMGFGEVRFGDHRSSGTPLVHRITNRSGKDMLCIDAEVLGGCHLPVKSVVPLVAERHYLVKVRDRVRVYKLVLNPGEGVEVSYAFFYLSVVLKGGRIESRVGGGEGAGGRSVSWTAEMVIGDVEWNNPTVGLVLRNTGETVFEQYIAEWC